MSYSEEQEALRQAHADKVAELEARAKPWQEVKHSESYYASRYAPKLVMRDGLKFGLSIGTGFVGLIMLIFGFLALGTTLDRHAVEGQCESKGTALGIPTQYVEHSFWSYDCYGEVLSGRYVPTDDINPSELFITGQAVTITPSR